MRLLLILPVLSLTIGCASSPRTQDAVEGTWITTLPLKLVGGVASSTLGEWVNGRVFGTDYRTEMQKELDREQLDKATQSSPDPNAQRGSNGATP